MAVVPHADLNNANVFSDFYLITLEVVEVPSV